MGIYAKSNFVIDEIKKIKTDFTTKIEPLMFK